MLTIYIHRKKVADIICMVYALMFTNLLNYCNLIRARTYDPKWAYAAFGLIAVYFLVLYIFTQICDWKMAAINLAVLIVAQFIRNGFGSFFLFLGAPDFASVLFMIFILCHRGHEAKKRTKSSFETEQE